MRLARKSMLLALAAIAAFAFTAGPASADPVQVVNEATATECSSITTPHSTGGCPVHASGTIVLEVFLMTWVVERTCDIELELRIAGDGTAATDDLDVYAAEGSSSTDCASNPPIVACELPWEGEGEEVEAGIHAMTPACVDPAEIDICGSEIEFDIAEVGDAGDETYLVKFEDSNVGAFCRVNGTLEMEAGISGNTPVHVNHI